jgi:hypothetical protein
LELIDDSGRITGHSEVILPVGCARLRLQGGRRAPEVRFADIVPGLLEPRFWIVLPISREAV